MSMKYRMDQDEIEKRIIGGAMNCLFGGWLLDKYVKAKVAPEMFKCPKRSKVYAAMVAEYEYERGEALPFSADDMLSICMGHKVSRQDAEEWRDLCPDRRTGERAMYTLLEYVAVQSITETLEDAREKIGTDKTTPESIAAEALDVLKVIISTSPEGAGMESPAEMATKIKAEAIESKALADAGKENVNGLKLPWGVLNSHYCGLVNGLHIVAARPSEGKTALAVNLSKHWADTGVKHLFVSLDMPQLELFKRYGSCDSLVSLSKIKDGTAHAKDVERYCASTDKYADGRIMFSGSSDFSDVKAAMYSAVNRGAKAVFIDYLQLIHKAGAKTRWDALFDIVVGLKSMATEELGIPIVLLAQMNRGAPNDKTEPEMHHIEGGGIIEQAASSVMSINRDQAVCQWFSECPPTHISPGRSEKFARGGIRPVWLNLLKNQQGGIGKFPFLMYSPWFALRPADFEATPDKPKRANDGTIPTLPFFDKVRDDWRTDFPC